jgi:hypothetical protein
MFVFGSITEELPDLTEELDEIYLHDNYNVVIAGEEKTFMDWAIEHAASVILVLSDPSTLAEEYLEEVSEILESDNPEQTMLELINEDDVALVSWDDTPKAHAQLSALCAKDVGIMDMADEYKQIVMDTSTDINALVKEITAKVTADVLKTVRAEMQELVRSRRFRSGPPKV